MMQRESFRSSLFAKGRKNSTSRRGVTEICRGALFRQQGSILRGATTVCVGLLFFMSSPFPAFGQEIGIYVSSKAGDRLTRKSAARFGSGEIRDITFHLNDSERHQTIIGFGASFLEAGMICLNSLAPQQQEEVLHALFNPRDGAGR